MRRMGVIMKAISNSVMGHFIDANCVSSLVVRSSFKTGSYQRVAGVDGHTSAA